MPRNPQRGATLVELVISIVIISIALVAVINTFVGTAARSADPLWQQKSLLLAQVYFDEILGKKYDHDAGVGGVPPYTGACRIGRDAGETLANRDVWNDVDDFDGLSGAPDLLDNTSSTYDNYSVAVSVSCAGNDLSNVSGNGDAKRISISVTPPGESAVTYSVYRGNY